MADLVIRPSIKGIIVWYVLSAFLVVAIVIFMQTRDFKPFELWALLVLPLAIDLWASMKHIRLNARRLTLQQGILRYEDGLVGKTQRNIILDKVRDVSMSQTLGQRLVGVGDLSVEALGESGNITLENVDRPRQIADAILEAMRQARQSSR
ncbi:MAG: PH domain-containing protein [Bryobacterales bacterium]|nr:PH domain-containing protein [Bryobacterales bacterium]